MVEEENIHLQEWFPDFHIHTMTYPLRGTSHIVKFVKKNNGEVLKKNLKADDEQVQLPTVHLCKLKIPRNLVNAFEVIEVSRAFKDSIVDVMKELFTHFSKEDNVLVIKGTKLSLQEEKEFYNFMNEKRHPLYFSNTLKSPEKDVRKWIKGEKRGDLVTDNIFATGFEADYVIALGTDYTISSAASRAIIKLACHIIPWKKKSKSVLTLEDGRKRLLESTTRKDFIEAMTLIIETLYKEIPSELENALKEMPTERFRCQYFPCHKFNTIDGCSGSFVHPFLGKDIKRKFQEIHVCIICYELFNCGFPHSAKNCPLLLQDMKYFLIENKIENVKALLDFLNGQKWLEDFSPCEFFNVLNCSLKTHAKKYDVQDRSRRIHMCKECFEKFHWCCFHPAYVTKISGQDKQRKEIAYEKCPCKCGLPSIPLF